MTDQTKTTGWQPISTAPKGLLILYHPPVFKEGRGLTHQEWIVVDRKDHAPHRPATHWMPLPEPPL